jgi:hypothetical protein
MAPIPSNAERSLPDAAAHPLANRNRYRVAVCHDACSASFNARERYENNEGPAPAGASACLPLDSRGDELGAIARWEWIAADEVMAACGAFMVA